MDKKIIINNTLKPFCCFMESQWETSETLQSGMPDFYIPGTAYQPDKIYYSVSTIATYGFKNATK